MELSEIFFNLMMTCVVVYLILFAGYLVTEEDDRKGFLESTLVEILAAASCYGFIFSLIGWIWTR